MDLMFAPEEYIVSVGLEANCVVIIGGIVLDMRISLSYKVADLVLDKIVLLLQRKSIFT